MLKKVVAGVLLIAGILTLSYPKLKEAYENRLQSQLLAEWKQAVAEADPQAQAAPSEQTEVDPTAAPAQAEQTKVDPTAAPTQAASATRAATAASEPTAEAQEEAVEYDPLLVEFLDEDESGVYDPDAEYVGPPPEYDELTVDGILGIEKIELELPVIKGVTNSNLRVSVASFTNGNMPGALGNYSIAGHRNLQYGRNFNRLNEVKVGDIITMTTKTNRYEYTVVERLFVDPDAVWVLDPDPEIKEITLITCHPMGAPTGRLIIKGQILDGEKPAE